MRDSDVEGERGGGGVETMYYEIVGIFRSFSQDVC